MRSPSPVPPGLPLATTDTAPALVKILLLILAALCWLAALPLGVLLVESNGPVAEGLAGLAFLAALFGGAGATGLFLLLLPGASRAGTRTAGAVMLLAPFALLGGAGWTVFALMLAASLGYAAHAGYRALTRPPAAGDGTAPR